MIKSFNELLEIAKKQDKMRLSVALAQDVDVLEAVTEARKLGLIEPILVGDAVKIKDILTKLNENEKDYIIENVIDEKEAAKIAVKLIKDKKADFLMKGALQTADIMRAVIDKECGLRTKNLISHVMVYEVTNYDKLLYLTDGGMNIAPSLQQKVQIIENCIKVTKAMGIDKVYVSALAAAEIVNPKVPATVDAAALADMKEHWAVYDAVVEGPVALDLAISKEACEHKKYRGEGAGQADIILVPYYEVGNALGKSLTYFAGGSSAGIIMGASVPIVLTSRADTALTKLYSIALGSVIAHNKHEE